MSGPTLLDALRACAIVFPGGILTVVGRTDCGLPVSVPLHEGAAREAIAALAALEARPLLEPHALEVAIRERDDARAHVERLAHEVSVNRDTIAVALEDCGAARNATNRAEAAYAAEKQAHGDTHRLLADASAEVERARAAATEAIRARMDAVNELAEAMGLVAGAARIRDESVKALDEAVDLLRGAAAETLAPAGPPSSCVDHGPDGVGC